MIRAIIRQAARETWGRSAAARLGYEIGVAIAALVVLQVIPGAPKASEELAVAVAGAGALLIVELTRYAIVCVRLVRTHPGAIRTREIRFDPPLSHQTADWLLKIDHERWRPHRAGWVLATHLVVENLLGEARAVPNFVMDSGARSNNRELSAEVLKHSEKLPSMPETVGPGEVVGGWMITPLSVRFAGGRPGYRVVAEELGDWRGFTRLDIDEPRRIATTEIPAILEELDVHRYWGAQIQGEIVRRHAELERGVRHPAWRDAALETLVNTSPARHVPWSQRVTGYLRDRLGGRYALRFESAWDANPTDVSRRIDAQLAVLAELSGEIDKSRTRE